MSIENEITARAYGKILAEGMSLADCELEGVIECEAVTILKRIEETVYSDDGNVKKVKKVRNILKNINLSEEL